jgi:DNA-binding IclR family transcriptional regulator
VEEEQARPVAPGAQTLRRGLWVLEAVAGHPDGVALSELARELGASRSTVHRFLSTLEDMGYVEQDVTGGQYRVGVRVLRLASGLFRGLPLRAAAHNELADLVLATGETAQVCVLDGLEVVYLDEIDSPHPLRMNTYVGMRLPAHSTAVGKAILAFLPDGERQGLVGWGLRARTSRTITDPGALLDALANVREHGYAVDDEEDMVGVRCIAAPVFDMRRMVVAAIGIAAPAGRLGPDDVPRVAERVVEAAQRVSTRLGVQPEETDPVPVPRAAGAGGRGRRAAAGTRS